MLWLFGFNPCFPGSSAERTPQRRQTVTVLGFNPCFPGSSAERPGCSLPFSAFSCVSILVFLDQALKADRRANVTLDQVRFQSLFSWIKR